MRGSTPHRLPSIRSTSCTPPLPPSEKWRAFRGRRPARESRCGWVSSTEAISPRPGSSSSSPGAGSRCSAACPTAFTPTLWIGDAASALVAAVDRAPSGLYDVVDDEPVRQRAAQDRARRGRGATTGAVTPGLARADDGRPGWGGIHQKPAYFQSSLPRGDRMGAGSPQCRRGHGASRRRESPALAVRVPATVRLGLWAMALFSLLAGIQQQFAPRSFYDDFPGFGMHWVAVDGPYQRAPAARSGRCEPRPRRGDPVRDRPAHRRTRPRGRGGHAGRAGPAFHLPRRASRRVADNA